MISHAQVLQRLTVKSSLLCWTCWLTTNMALHWLIGYLSASQKTIVYR